jgi:hypothetical protein
MDSVYGDDPVLPDGLTTIYYPSQQFRQYQQASHQAVLKHTLFNLRTIEYTKTEGGIPK